MQSNEQSADFKKLEAEIEQLAERIWTDRKTSRRTSRISVGFALGITGLISCFLLVNYARLRAEWTPEKFGPSIEAELREMSPTALKEFGRLGEDLLPVYAAEWKSQLQQSWPQISRVVEDEILSFGANLEASVHGLLEESEARVIEETRRQLLQSYPDLEDPAVQHRVNNRLQTTCNEAVGKALNDFDQLFSRDVVRIQEAIWKFDVGDQEESTVDLQKKFLHLWLQLLDQEIMKI